MNSMSSFVVWVLMCLGIGMVGGLVTRPAIASWYATLAKPWWTPPDWIFGPVWTVLYVLMAIAGWRVWVRRASSPAAAGALRLFAIQLLFNAIWSPLFFGLRAPALGLIDILALWAVIIATLRAMRPVDRMAATLFVPYLLWVSFAGCLNAAIWWLNR